MVTSLLLISISFILSLSRSLSLSHSLTLSLSLSSLSHSLYLLLSLPPPLSYSLPLVLAGILFQLTALAIVGKALYPPWNYVVQHWFNVGDELLRFRIHMRYAVNE
jgi:hypothetical protein